MVEYLGKIHALLHEFNELLPPASTPAEELEQQLKFFMLLALHGLSDEYSHVRDQILGLLLCPTSLLLVLPFYACQEDKLLIHLLVLMTPQSWPLSGMIAIVFASRERDDPSVTIVAS